MSAASRSAAREAAPTRRPPTDEPPVRFRDLVAAEWIKLWSLRSTPWLLAVIAAAVIAVNADGAMTEIANFRSTTQPPDTMQPPDVLPPPDSAQPPDTSPPPAPDAFTAFRAIRAIFGDVAVLLVVLTGGSVGALAVAGEYATGTARTTFTAVPDRRAVVAAKAVVVTAVMLAYGTALVATSFAVTQAILAGEGIGVTPETPGAARAVAVSAVMPPVCALVGMALGALLRGVAGTLMAIMVVLILAPMFLDDDARWSAAVDHAQPVSAWERLVMVGPAPGSGWSTAGFAQSWAVLAAWAVVALAVALVAVHHKDV